MGKFKEALEIVRRSIPFPSVCGRVCFSPCEDACTRADIDEPVRIRSLKRLVADYEVTAGTQEKPNPSPKTHSEKIAVIGAGPAGLTAAFDLVKLGYSVTVFERSAKLGGSLRYCIPEYRLPEKVLDYEITNIKAVGVEIRTGVSFGKDISLDDIKKRGFKSVFIATGAHHGLQLELEGKDLKGVLNALNFLGDVSLGNHIDLGNRAAVIGGGNVAIDTARTAKRVGPKEVTVVYRRSEKEMPAHKHEVEDAKLEGVKFNFLATPRKILGQEGKVVALECVRNILGVPDESGRRRPVPVEGSEFIIPADSVLLAIGEMPEVDSLPKELAVSRQNRIIVDDVTLQTSLPGVFAGGDNVSGPASVIEAIAAGKRVAVSIDRYLRGVDLKAGRKKKIQHVTWVSDKSTLLEKVRQPLRRLTPKERLGCFKEVDLGLTADSGLLEARRCLFCGGCTECLEPEGLCEGDDIIVDSDKCIACTNCEKACEFGAIKVEKSVAKVDSFICKGCGTCVVECPAKAITLHEFSDQEISSQLSEAALSCKRESSSRTVTFMCNWSSNRQTSDFVYPKNMQIIPVRCAGRVDPLHILQAFKLGAEGVLVVSCVCKDCHYVLGGSIAEKRVRQVKGWLQAIGMDPKRLQRIESSVGDEKHLSGILKNFADNLEQPSPSSLKTHHVQDDIHAEEKIEL